MSTPRKPKAGAESVVPDAELNEVAAIPAAAAEVVAAPPMAPAVAPPVAPAVAPTPAVAPPVTPTPIDAPEAAVPASATAVAPPSPPPPPAAPTAPAGPPPGAQVAAAISGLATGIKEKLSTAELLLGSGALLIAGLSFLVLGFVLGAGGPSGIYGPTEAAVVVSVLLIALIGLERTQTEGFGSWYRVLLIVLGAILAIGAAYSLLTTLRHSTSYLGGLDWLSVLIWWIGGGLAGVGAWMTYKVKA